MNINCNDYSNIINSVLSGMFSIVALLPAAYALIINSISKHFCGMPIVKIKRYRFIWFIIPIASLLFIYFLIIITEYNLYVFTGLFILFLLYLCIYLYILLFPLFKKEKFYRIAARSLINELNAKFENDELLIFYLEETIKSYSSNEGISRKIYIDLYYTYDKNALHIEDIRSANKLLDLARLLFVDESSSRGYSEFFVELGNSSIPLNYKFNYVSLMFKQIDKSRIDLFCVESKTFLSHTLKEYLTTKDINTISRSVIDLLMVIVSNSGLTYLISDIYNASKYDIKYIDVLYIFILGLRKTGYDFEVALTKERDKILITELFQIVDEEKNRFQDALQFCNTLETLELVIVVHKRGEKN